MTLERYYKLNLNIYEYDVLLLFLFFTGKITYLAF